MKTIAPGFLFTVMWLLWFVMFSFIPYSYDNITPIFSASLSLLLDVISFYIGIYFIKIFPRKESTYNIELLQNKMRIYSITTKKLFKISIILGFIGVILKLYLRFYLQDFGSYESVTEFRLHLNDDQMSGGIAGLVAGLTYPFGFVALTLLIYFKDFWHVKKHIQILVWLLGLFIAIDGILVGGRTSIVLLASLLFFTYRIKAYLSMSYKYMTGKKIIYAFLFFVGFMYLSSNIIVQRLESYGMTIDAYLQYMKSGREITINPVFANFIQNSDTFGLKNLVFAFVEFMHYYVHGVFEYIRLYNHFNFDKLWYGLHEYYVYTKLFEKLNIIDLSYAETLQGYYKTGVYTTFFGPSLIDFGYFVFLYIMAIGSIFQILYQKALSGMFSGIILYPFAATIIIFSPMINLMMGSVLYILNALLISYLIVKTRVSVLKYNASKN